MKYVIKGGIMAAIAFMVIVAAMIISGRSVRKNELENTLEHATKQTVEYLKKNPQIDRQEFVQYFKNNLEMGIESDSEILVSIIEADTEKGILSVHAEGNFQNCLGKKEKVEANKTVILEKYQLEKKKQYTAVYKIAGEIYKVYKLTEGSKIPTPVNPDGNFEGWMDENGQVVYPEEIQLETDRIFYGKLE
ncbi:DUF948 domain-containing protein [Roseburia sp. MSJ-14]|uniref:DUF948 domain-containing protein n=1 Tax=Roseburia sp. MSJ-14 TaxID=2841514 RepID=UPI001C111E92|nr:DUF948 domain-containing protein [Roseburia sp. MSJ-14]MBU5472087.1 hypothetical protein [Roseburia sp. MSJ-14]